MNTRDRNEVRQLAVEGEQTVRELTVAELDEVTGGSISSSVNNVIKAFGNALQTAARGG